MPSELSPTAAGECVTGAVGIVVVCRDSVLKSVMPREIGGLSLGLFLDDFSNRWRDLILNVKFDKKIQHFWRNAW